MPIYTSFDDLHIFQFHMDVRSKWKLPILSDIYYKLFNSWSR